MNRARPDLTTQLDLHRDPSERLLAAWQPVLDTLAALIDESTFNIWMVSSLHPHRKQAGVWILATRPQQVRWMTDRFGRLLAAAAGCPVRIVACEEQP